MGRAEEQPGHGDHFAPGELLDVLARARTRGRRAIEQLWRYDLSALSATASVPLGHANCFGDTFDWTTSTVVADVYALHPDGSEQKVNAAPLLLPAP